MSIVSGISVSVSVSPPAPPLSASGIIPGAPMKKRYEVSAVEVIEVIDVSSDEEEESVSPRVLFPVGDVARRLDFYSSGEWSPIPVASVAGEKKEEEKSVGDCNICYDSLPARSNHVFTLCGHLFCVKCLLRWWDTAITCPICRANILEVAADTAGAGAGGTVSAAIDIGGWEIEASASDSESDSDNNDFVGDDNVGGGVGGVDRGLSITSFNRYLHIDSSVEWSAAGAGVTHPEYDDEAVQLSQVECDNIRWSREIAMNLFTRARFLETLFSNIEFSGNGGMVHEFIPKQQWIEIGHDQMGPHLMFEFIMRGTASYNTPMETNFFGYISSIVVVRVAADAPRRHYHDADDDWENSHEYAFIVHVFSPVAPYGRYDIDDGTFETAELLFRFSDIRRMYSMSATA
jgi:hypothetical protein